MERGREGGGNIFGVSWFGIYFIFYFLGGVQASVRPIRGMFLVKKKVNAIFFYRGGVFGRKTDYWV